ncbi:MAG: N-acetyltransferase [Bradymonadales bacterium]|nr:N-acetyltransferase [Bradymonadales bacterium]
MAGARIGRDCILGQNCFVAGSAVIGDRVKIQNNVSVYAGCILEEEVFLGPSCVLTNVVNPRAHIERKSEFREIRIRRGATIGANATLVCPVTIGCHALVGAGAVVTRDVPDFGLALGVPARQVGYVCRCGTTLIRWETDGSESLVLDRLAGSQEAVTCPACGAGYLLDAHGLRETDRPP